MKIRALFLRSLFAGSYLFFATVSASAAKVPPPGKFVKQAAVSIADAKTRCVVDPKLDIAPANLPCRVSQFAVLGGDGVQTFYAAWNHRPSKTARSKDEQTEQLVLFSGADGSDSITPFWSDVVEFFGDTPDVTQPSVHKTAHGLFLQLDYASGGTGGSWSEFFLEQNGKWEYLQQAYGKEAEKCLPKEFGIQSIQVDLEKMQAEAAAPTEDDPNCCPSGKVTMGLKVVGDVLRGVGCQFSKVK